MRGHPFDPLWTGHAKLIDGRRELARIGLSVAVEVSPSLVRQGEHRYFSDHLPVGGVERAWILLGLGEHDLSRRIGVELEVAGRMVDLVTAVRPG